MVRLWHRFKHKIPQLRIVKYMLSWGLPKFCWQHAWYIYIYMLAGTVRKPTDWDTPVSVDQIHLSSDWFQEKWITMSSMSRVVKTMSRVAFLHHFSWLPHFRPEDHALPLFRNANGFDIQWHRPPASGGKSANLSYPLVMTNIANWTIHFKWRFLAGKMICKWAIFQFAMSQITRG